MQPLTSSSDGKLRSASRSRPVGARPSKLIANDELMLKSAGSRMLILEYKLPRRAYRMDIFFPPRVHTALLLLGGVGFRIL